MKDSELTELAAQVHRALLDADLRVVVTTGTGSDWGEFGTYDDQIEAMTSALLRAGLLRFDEQSGGVS